MFITGSEREKALAWCIGPCFTFSTSRNEVLNSGLSVAWPDVEKVLGLTGERKTGPFCSNLPIKSGGRALFTVEIVLAFFPYGMDADLRAA